MENILSIGENTIFAIMIFASILALAVTIEKGLLYRHHAKTGAKIFSDILNDLRNKKIDNLSVYMETYPESIYARFASFIKDQYACGEASILHMLESKMIEERMYLERRLTILTTLGSNAPFIGLLGTVLGIIKAFYNLGTLGNTGTEIVMKNISTALLSTAVGLLVAIPVVMLNNYFSKKLKVIMQNLEIISRETLASYQNKKQ